MNEWFKQFFEKLSKLLGNWTIVQKLIFFTVIIVVITGVVLLTVYNSTPNMVPLITSPIKDEDMISKISMRLDQENVKHHISEDGRVFVADKKIARRVVSILFREGLIPGEASPWDIFKMDKWTLTDFERNVNLRQAITKNVEQHIESLDDVDSARVTLVIPEERLFAEDQKDVTASIIITPRPGSDIIENRKKIEGIVRLVKFAVEGLDDENITITDFHGNIINDFAGMANMDRLALAERQMKAVRKLESQYKSSMLKSLRQIFGADRVEIVNLDITMDLGKEVIETEEHFPITMKKDNPKTPFDETEVIKSITLSESSNKEDFQGTGFNPEGPPGQEGQTPPAYKDLEGMVGKYSRNSLTKNEVVNKENRYVEKSPWELKRITAAVAIDGFWKWKYDDKGQVVINSDGSINREYIAVTDSDLAKAKTLVEHAIGFNRDRGDSVSVEHLQFNRATEHSSENEKYRNRLKMRQTFVYSLIALAVLIVAFAAFRLISRELERKRRLREEELARQHQAMREAALRSAEEEGIEVQMSVEERARMEMQENAINMAREHPEDVAQLIRTWLMEE